MTPDEERAAMANVAAAATALRDAIRASGLDIFHADVDILHDGNITVHVRDDIVVRASGGKYKAAILGSGLGNYPVEVTFDVSDVTFFGLVDRQDPLCERALLRAQALERRSQALARLSQRTGPPGSRFASFGRGK